MSARLDQPSFSSGELGPSLIRRKDTAKYQTGLRRMRNCLGAVGGGFYNRPGFAWVGTTRFPDRESRLLPFQFSLNQSYALEFGERYMRVILGGAYVTETELLITGATNANPVVLTVVAHGWATGDDVYLTGVVGMKALNGRTARVTVVDDDHVSLDGIDGTAYGAFTSATGGVAGDSAGGVGGNPPGGPVVPDVPPPYVDQEPDPVNPPADGPWIPPDFWAFF